jgi:hypothetical protein
MTIWSGSMEIHIEGGGGVYFQYLLDMMWVMGKGKVLA